MSGNCINTFTIASSPCVFNTYTHSIPNLDTDKSLCFLHAADLQAFKKPCGQTYVQEVPLYTKEIIFDPSSP